MANDVLVFGHVPRKLIIPIVIGSDFKRIFEEENGVAWPAGTAVSLVWPDLDLSWGSTISGAEAEFVVDKSDCDLIPDNAKVRLVFTDTSGDYVLALGRAKRYDHD